MTHIPFERKGSEVDEKSFIKKMARFMDNREEELLLENMVQTAESIKKALEEVPGTGFCLDVGHANISHEENISTELLKDLKDRVKYVHLHDNKGGDSQDWDLHLPIGVGTIDFHSIFHTLKKIGYSGVVTLEIGSHGIDYQKVSLERVKNIIGNV